MGEDSASATSLLGGQPASGGGVLLDVKGLAKAFGPTQALRNGSLQLRGGEVHALMGENGSGKSTLVKILSGVHRPDAGSIEVGGQPVGHLRSPRDSADVGVYTVFQEILVAAQQTVLANIWMGSDGLLRRRLTSAERLSRARETLGRLIAVDDLDQAADNLSLSDRQAVCISRVLVRAPRILILDEATSALDVATRDNLFAMLRDLCAEGVGVLFISHRMDEVEEIADRVTVLRSGETVATRERGQATPRELVALMTGSDLTPEVMHRGADSAATRVRSTVALRATEVRLREGCDPINVEIHPGELVGVAGLEGHGQDEFLRVLAGARPVSGSVTCLVGDGEHELRSPSDALARGVAYVPRDRRRESIFESRSILENFQLATVAADRRGRLVRRAPALARFEHYASVLRIRAGRRSNPITSLSGGNQQKVVIARWLAMNPKILVLNDPTRGVDAGTKGDIYRVLNEAAADGVAVVMLSTELIELIELMDRVLVFREDHLFADLPREQLTRTRLVESYFGHAGEQ
ncbi:MAG TPA: sugar ABC transporter ATP-binding protein [Solirubrobacteraceae bacterium]